MPDIFRTEGYSSGILLGRTALASWFALGLSSGRAAAAWYQGYHLHPPHPPPHAANAALACCQQTPVMGDNVACFLSITNSHRLSGCMRIKTRSEPLLASKASFLTVKRPVWGTDVAQVCHNPGTVFPVTHHVRVRILCYLCFIYNMVKLLFFSLYNIISVSRLFRSQEHFLNVSYFKTES